MAMVPFSHNSPCAACKFLRRKCTNECVFAPYFPPEQPSKFATVHRVFGASNIAKILNEISPGDREDAVTSLFYEADARLRDPVYGCVGYISLLQQRLKELHFNIAAARHQLSCYDPTPLISPNFNPNPTPPPQQMQLMGIPSGSAVPGPMINNLQPQHQHPHPHPHPYPHHQHQHQQQQQQLHNLMQIHEAQQMNPSSSTSSQQEMINRAYDQQLQLQQLHQLQQEAICRVMDGGGVRGEEGSVTLTGYNQIGNQDQHHMGVSPISLAIGTNDGRTTTMGPPAVIGNDDGRFQLFLQQPQERADKEEDAMRRRNIIGP
ncbi:LOB domain-containing protein 36 [Linum perenne]